MFVPRLALSGRLTPSDLTNHRVVTFIRHHTRPGYSYGRVRTTTVLERDFRASIARSLLRSGFRLPLRANTRGIARTNVTPDIVGNTGIRHITFDDTSATAHTLPKNAMHLTKIQLYGGSAGGSLIAGYRENRFAHFPVSISGEADYDLDYTVTGNAIASGFWTTDGTAPADWGLTFSEKGWGGPNILTYLADLCTVTAGGAVTTITNMTSVNFDAGEATPTGVAAYVATAAAPAVVYFPGEPGFQGGIRCQNSSLTFQAPIAPAPRVSPANAITMAYIAAAAGRINAWVYYKPTVGS